MKNVSGLNSSCPHHPTLGGWSSADSATKAQRGRGVCPESHSIRVAGLNFGPSLSSLSLCPHLSTCHPDTPLGAFEKCPKLILAGATQEGGGSPTLLPSDGNLYPLPPAREIRGHKRGWVPLKIPKCIQSRALPVGSGPLQPLSKVCLFLLCWRVLPSGWEYDL